MRNSFACGRSWGVARLLPAAVLLAASLAPSIDAYAADSRLDKFVYQIRDAGLERPFEIAADEVHIVSGARQHRAQRMAARSNAEDVRLFADTMRRTTGEEVSLVLYEADRPRTPYTRRVLTSRVLVRLADGADAQALADGIGARLLGGRSYAAGYVLFETDETGGALGLAESLRGQPGVLSAEPLLARQQKKKFAPNDTLYSAQWHLRNTGQNGGVAGIDVNITNVWDSFKGAGQKIAIVDDGLQTTHEDLAANVDTVNDYDFNGGDKNPDPALSEDFHGTSCAGVAGGRGNNGLGISGAAPEAQLVGLRLIGGPATDQDEADAMAHSNQIIFTKSNSWGPDDDGLTLAGPGPLTAAALRDGCLNGRGGKGAIYAWACGNGADSLDNANYDGYANSIYTIAIGAISDQGTKASYSEPGANVVVSAPSSSFNPDTQGITTADLMGENGYNYTGASGELSNKNYTKTFGGTSSATPLAAGVMSLILQAAPGIGWRDMQEILIRSAKKNNLGDSDWRNNAAGFHFNHKYGAGLLDARAAIAMAQSWTNLGPQVSVAQVQTNLSVAIPDNNAVGITRTFSFSNQNVRVEHVTLAVDITHFNRGDLTVQLISPSATTSQLAEVHNDTGDHYRNWVFMTVRDWGEQADGTWTVKIADRRASYAGSLRYLRLEVFGTALSVNSPPVLNPVGNKNATVSNLLSFAVSASDANGDPIALTISNKPAGAAFSAAGGSGTFTWTNPAPAGVYTTRFFAADGQGGVDSETVAITVSNPPAGGAPANVWINEIHYDNGGADVNEGVEVAGAAGVDLSAYSLLLYNGGDGAVYATIPLSGLIDNESCGFGARWFASAGIQNGAPDGVALVRNGTQVLQFLSYEGAFTAGAGAAAGLTSANIGVSEAGTDPAGRSLQLKGNGDAFADFAWNTPGTASAGSLNAGQTIAPCGSGVPPMLQTIGNRTVVLSNNLQFAVTATDADGDAIALSVSNKPAGSTFSSTGGSGAFAWTNAKPTGVYTATFYAADNDGADSETITLTVVPPASGSAVWINEIHYDNTGSDANEGVEIAGTAGTALSNYSLLFYNGSDGAVYKTTGLSGTIDNEGCGFGALWFAASGLQNGAPDGVALVQNDTTVIQFLSYEGAFTATAGAAAGQPSVNVGVQEAGTETDQSLQLKGGGNAYNQFTWSAPSAASRGSLNAGQSISPCGGGGGTPPQVRFLAAEYTFSEEWGAQAIPVSVSASGNATVKVAVAGTATLGGGQDYTLSATTLVFTAGGATQMNVTVSLNNDASAEAVESIILTLTNLAGATTGAITRATLHVRDSDSFTVMTANLSVQPDACGSEYRDPAARIFRGLKPDIVAIQEFVVTNSGGYSEFVANNFGADFHYFVESESGSSCVIPNGIISRWPILASGEWSDPYVGYRDFTWATIDIPGPNNLNVVCVHLDFSDPNDREPEAHALTNYIAQAGFPASDYLLICGDLNSTTRVDAANRVLTNLVTDAHKPADQNGDQDTNSSRNKPYDYVLPELALDALHLPAVVGGLTFSNGLVFESSLWSPPPAPILSGDSNTEGIQHMAVMKRFSMPAGGGGGGPPNVWINEIHYDNASVADTNEGVEVAGPAGTALTNFSLVTYNGSSGLNNGSTPLSGVIDAEQNGFGAVWFGITPLQNESEGLALVYAGTTVVQFISYEGSFVANDPPATGMTASDIVVSQQPAPAPGNTLQLIGSGSTYSNFAWTGPVAQSIGTLNSGQSIVGGARAGGGPGKLSNGQPPSLQPIGDQTVSSGDGLYFGVTATDEAGDPISLSVSNEPPGSLFESFDGNGQFSWLNAGPAGVYTMEVWAVDEDGADFEIFTITVSEIPPPADLLALYTFDDAAEAFVVSPESTAPQLAASDLTAFSGAPFPQDGHQSSNAASQTGWTGVNYYEFSVVVSNGFTAVPYQLSFDDHRPAAGGPPTWGLRYSGDGFTSDLGSGGTHNPFGSSQAPLTQIQLEGTNVFRLYGRNAFLPANAWRIDNLLLQGVVLPTGQDADHDGMPDAWELAMFNDADNADLTTDFDEDRFLDLHEYLAGTSPRDETSLLRMGPFETTPDGGVVIRWTSEENRTYRLERASDLLAGFSVLQTNISATPQENSYTDSPPAQLPLLIYRVGVE